MKPQSGISLLEVIIAVILLAFASSLLIVNSKTSSVGNKSSKVYAEASTATKEVLESLQQLGLDSLTRIQAQRMNHSQSSSISVLAKVRNVLPADIDDFTNQDTSSLRFVDLTTTFKNATGGTVTKKFSTIFFKP